ncbi:hypothetical protein [Virgibacillus salexigens]|uniref:Haemolysin XhlA n=2 Tax=Virgibacillus TaxID=84406 RepID=A0A024QAL3_9BACI|nr:MULTISPECIES: hypothetical protein [Virgibacillus]GGJ48418.1 hypothetical protein GCM10007111_08130 [Virgibacillus kapii]CDQ39563.1 hypothetical protein BN990_01868 [Virgibacillus massiliensis]
MSEVGEETTGVKLIEQNVKHNVEDIRELKKRVNAVEKEVHDVKATQQVTNQSVSHIMETLSELKSGVKELDGKIDASNIEQLKEYKNAVWKVGITIIGTVIAGFLLFSFGLK